MYVAKNECTSVCYFDVNILCSAMRLHTVLSICVYVLFCFFNRFCLDEVEATPGIVYYHGAVCHDTIRLVFSC